MDAFDKLRIRIAGIGALHAKAKAMLTGDKVQMAEADKAFAQTKFLLKSDHGIGYDTATKAAATGDGIVAGIASSDSMDLCRHVVMAGAFSESIRKRGLTGPGAIKLLLDHDWQKPAGLIRKLEYQGGKLMIEAQLNLDIEYVRDRYSAMKMLGGFNFSVGFVRDPTECEYKLDGNKQEYLEIRKGDLFEVSLVAFPANEDATLTNIKAASSLDPALASINRIQALLGTLK